MILIIINNHKTENEKLSTIKVQKKSNKKKMKLEID
jgi:hypothetical protein